MQSNNWPVGVHLIAWIFLWHINKVRTKQKSGVYNDEANSNLLSWFQYCDGHHVHHSPNLDPLECQHGPKVKVLSGLRLMLGCSVRVSHPSSDTPLLTSHSGCICSMIRFRFVDGLTQTDDFFWNVVNISIWSTIEAGACIVAGCLATLRPLLKSAVHQARESNALSGCVKQISRSLRSGSHSQPNSNSASSIPHHHATPSLVNSNHYDTERKQSETTLTAEPTFLEFLARPGEEVIPLSSDIESKRTSTDPILERPEPAEFPWPVRGRSHRYKGKRQAVHGSWTLQRGSGGERTSGRPTSAPVSPDFFLHAQQIV
jgi:hypothetical protein